MQHHDKEFEVGDYVEATGLLNSKHLNGQIGKVVKVKTASGRLAVKFLQDEGSALPKLIQSINLKNPVIPLHKDEPWPVFVDVDGNGIWIKIENGKGKTCVDCECDLDGKYFLYTKGEYRCEEDYVKKFNPQFHTMCVQCHKYVEWRKREMTPFGLNDAFDELYPDGKLEDGSPVKFTFKENTSVYCAHKECLSCLLCGDKKAPYGYVYRLTLKKSGPVQIPPFEITCSAPPGSTGWCSNEIESYKKASKRLMDVTNMPMEDIQQILRDRNVPWKDNEEKASLLCKVIVTDGVKGDKKAHIVTCNQNGHKCHTKVSQREAPGAVLRDRSCNHGVVHRPCDETPAETRKREVLNYFSINVLFAGGSNSRLSPERLCEFWVQRQEILMEDIEDRIIQRILWSATVNSAITEEGGFSYQAYNIFAFLIVGALIDQIAFLLPNERLTMVDALAATHQPQLLTELALAGITESPQQEKLYLFMHQPEKRYCDCMKYVAAAAEIGILRDKNPRIKTDVPKCAFCNAALARPWICSGCHEVAYCDKLHQKQHWKVHKKQCKGCKKQCKGCKKKCRAKVDGKKETFITGEEGCHPGH